MAGEDFTAVTARDPNIEQDVRAIVQRIVDGLFADEAALGAPSPAQAVDVAIASSHGPDEAEGAAVTTGTIAIGADHGGFALKERLGFRLKERGHRVIDCGTDSTDAVDYPDYAVAVASKVASGEADVGIMVDGAGIGSAMAANKIPGVRAALCYDVSTARNAREHNHANMVTLGAGLIGDGLAWQIVQEFLATPYGGGRHARRVAKIDALDEHGHVPTAAAVGSG
jgi:ribose 5-phosphate isomerase B